MDRKEITRSLSRLLEEHINPYKDPRVYWAKEVTFDYATEHSAMKNMPAKLSEWNDKNTGL